MKPTIQSPLPTALEQIDRRPLTANQKSLITLAVLANIAEFFDIFIIGFAVNALLKDPTWHLRGDEAGIILAMSGLGTVVGAIGGGRLADAIGRKQTSFWRILVFSVSTVVSVFTPTGAWQLLLLRVLVGMGVGGMNIVSIPYVQEFVPARQRGLLSGLAAIFIPLGLFLGSAASWATGADWRLLIALGGLPVFLLIWLAFVPESPRFLQSKGQHAEARKALAWALQMPVDGIGALPTLAKATSASFSLIFSRHLNSLVIVSLGSFCFIFGASVIQAWGQSILGSAYKFSTEAVADLFMLVALGDLLGRLSSAWLADQIGRKKVMFLYGLLGGIGLLVSAASTMLASATDGAGWIFFAGILIAMTFGDGAFGVLNPFGAEQFPNEARSTGLGLGYGIGASAKIFGPALLGVMFGAHVNADIIPPAFLLFAVLLFVGGIAYQFAQETKGRSLESIGSVPMPVALAGARRSRPA